MKDRKGILLGVLILVLIVIRFNYCNSKDAKISCKEKNDADFTLVEKHVIDSVAQIEVANEQLDTAIKKVKPITKEKKVKPREIKEQPKLPEIQMIFVKGDTLYFPKRPKLKAGQFPGPKSLVTTFVSDFYISKYEVTQLQWKCVIDNNPSSIVGDNLPVTNISWRDAQIFCSKLNELTGKQYRLPKEVEWEFAARGGVKSKKYIYSGGNVLKDVAWFKENSNNQIHQVGQKAPNELGIFDMTGNVSEFCVDFYWDFNAYKDYHNYNFPDSPLPKYLKLDRISRGGNFLGPKEACKIGSRLNSNETIKYPNTGIRLITNSHL